MSQALSALVAKTANWSVEALRNELLVLNKLAFSVRYQADRTDLMQVCDSCMLMLDIQAANLTRLLARS